MRKILTVLTALIILPFASFAKDPEVRLDIVPYPQSVEIGKGSVKIAGAQFYCDPRLDSLSRVTVASLAGKLSLVTGKISTNVIGISSTIAPPQKGFVFLFDKAMEDEEYSISATAKCITVKASSSNGFLYAVQTIKQMLPTAVYGRKMAVSEDWSIPVCEIKDKPRFKYRGMHLDCARHFFPVEEVKRYLDIMAVHKLNRFHWHLSDDQGWRIEIKNYPRLTEIGAYRSGTMIGKDFGSNDGIVYGGYYTQAQIKEVVKYAAGLGITVIPEIDLPGHMLGALSAYPQMGCTGGPYEVWTKWGVSNAVLCPGKEDTFYFLEGVLTEVMEIFPSEYIHIGGDECPKDHWKTCPDCQKRIAELGLKSDDKHSAEDYLQNYVTSRIQAFLGNKGRKIIGWDEILEGNLSEGATVMSWRGVDGGIQAAKMGFDAIMTPNTYCYFDYCQALKSENENEPLNIGGELPIEKVYGYEPFDGMDENSAKHILGVQANLWTEYIEEPEHLEYMLLPRMAALSEIQWCDQSRKDFERFKTAIDHEFKIYDTLGYTYSKVIKGIHGYKN
ncbi:MAG: beta-N-acetylhexosaminidase [Bacteroidales bacterium]|nr:beta-N-acetylhexosaminidase [Bacteroidales bacterium]